MPYNEILSNLYHFYRFIHRTISRSFIVYIKSLRLCRYTFFFFQGNNFGKVARSINYKHRTRLLNRDCGPFKIHNCLYFHVTTGHNESIIRNNFDD